MNTDDSVSTNNDTLNVNIELSVKASPTKSSSSKKRKPSATTQMLEDELKAEASNRRNSMNVANMVGETANLTLMVASLRRQNEDLKAKLADSKGSSKRASENLSSIDKMLMEQKESECDDLKKTVANLEKLLALEREERCAHEKTTLELLDDVKKKWHDR